MTLQLLHSEFLIYEENLIFFFISVAFLLSSHSGLPPPAQQLSQSVVACYLCSLLLFLPSVKRVELACPSWLDRGGARTQIRRQKKNCGPLSKCCIQLAILGTIFESCSEFRSFVLITKFMSVSNVIQPFFRKDFRLLRQVSWRGKAIFSYNCKNICLHNISAFLCAPMFLSLHLKKTPSIYNLLMHWRILPGSIVLAVFLSIKAPAIKGIYRWETRGGIFWIVGYHLAKVFFQK